MIMFIDDDSDMRDMCTLFLESQGYQITAAASAADGLRKIREEQPELVISDCAMPGMSGVELSECLRADPQTAHLPILLISASMRCEMGAKVSWDGFLRKPFLAETLLLEVQKLLAGIAAGAKGKVGV